MWIEVEIHLQRSHRPNAAKKGAPSKATTFGSGATPVELSEPPSTGTAANDTLEEASP
jgi:hypothetical protein